MQHPRRVTFVYRNYEGLGVSYIAAYIRSLGHQVQLVLYPDPWADSYVKQKDRSSPTTGRLQTRVEAVLQREVVDFGPDLICLGEGDRSLLLFLEQLDGWKAGADLEIPGIWYAREGEEVRQNGSGEAIQELDDLPFPAKDLF